jgi:hypothetical protein
MKSNFQKWGVAGLLALLIGAVILLQTELSDLKSDLLVSKADGNKANADLINYDKRVGAAFEEFEKRTFGEKVVLANPYPVEFQEPGRKTEGEIYRFLSLCTQAVNGLPKVSVGDLRALPAEKKQ